jgi:hypothetical protein
MEDSWWGSQMILGNNTKGGRGVFIVLKTINNSSKLELLLIVLTLIRRCSTFQCHPWLPCKLPPSMGR